MHPENLDILNQCETCVWTRFKWVLELTVFWLLFQNIWLIFFNPSDNSVNGYEQVVQLILLSSSVFFFDL